MVSEDCERPIRPIPPIAPILPIRQVRHQFCFALKPILDNSVPSTYNSHQERPDYPRTWAGAQELRMKQSLIKLLM